MILINARKEIGSATRYGMALDLKPVPVKLHVDNKLEIRSVVLEFKKN